MKVKIGTVTISESKEFTRYFEYAAYYQTIVVEPCTVDVFGDVKDNGEVGDTSIVYTVTGPIISSNPSTPGKVIDYHAFPYSHALAKQIIEGRSDITLDGFKAIIVDFIYDSKPCQTYAIVRA